MQVIYVLYVNIFHFFNYINKTSLIPTENILIKIEKYKLYTYFMLINPQEQTNYK